MLLIVTSFFCFACAGKKVPMHIGENWLASKTGTPSINIDGTWLSNDWGMIMMKFRQCDGCREISGATTDGYTITGVVTGEKVSLLFLYNNKIICSAVLTKQSETELSGSYASGKLINENSKNTPLRLKRW